MNLVNTYPQAQQMGGGASAELISDDYWKWLEDYQPSWTVVLVLLAVVTYVARYYLLVVDRPRVVGGGTTLREHIVNHCPILSQYYYPTFWALNHHFTTIGRAKLQTCPGVQYNRYDCTSY